MIGKASEYKAMATCEGSLWWYKCLHDLTLNTLAAYQVSKDSSILDAGCGTGGLLTKLLSKGYTNLSGFDLSEDAIDYASKATHLDLKIHDITSLVQHYDANSFDIIMSHDIVCLLPPDKDAEAINQLFRILKPGGILMMNLPALSAFQGTHDLAVGITKRYSKSAIRALIGWRGNIENMVYWPFALSIPIYFTRLAQRTQLKIGSEKPIISDVKMINKTLNSIFYKVSTLENNILKSKPWGSSLFITVKKNP
jgi:SAM-dependent methyltransferase